MGKGAAGVTAGKGDRAGVTSSGAGTSDASAGPAGDAIAGVTEIVGRDADAVGSDGGAVSGSGGASDTRTHGDAVGGEGTAGPTGAGGGGGETGRGAAGGGSGETGRGATGSGGGETGRGATGSGGGETGRGATGSGGAEAAECTGAKIEWSGATGAGSPRAGAAGEPGVATTGEPAGALDSSGTSGVGGGFAVSSPGSGGGVVILASSTHLARCYPRGRSQRRLARADTASAKFGAPAPSRPTPGLGTPGNETPSNETPMSPRFRGVEAPGGRVSVRTRSNASAYRRSVPRREPRGNGEGPSEYESEGPCHDLEFSTRQLPGGTTAAIDDAALPLAEQPLGPSSGPVNPCAVTHSSWPRPEGRSRDVDRRCPDNPRPSST